MNPESLARLLERAQNGDADAWGDVYREMAPFIFRLCRRVLPSREDAEDATAEVFLKAQLHLGQYDAGRPFRGWLYRVAANHCWDEFRRRKSRPEHRAAGDAEIDITETHQPSPYLHVLAGEMRERVRSALAGLNDRARMAMVMRYYAELSYAEIADVLGVTPSFVGVLLLRARRQLRQTLSRSED